MTTLPNVVWFLANVRELTFTFAICHRPSVYRVSVCLSSVTLVHPTQPVEISKRIFDFSSVVWSPHFRCDIEKIENVQKRFIKAILPHFTYSARLSKLKLQTLEMRRITTDLTMCYKLLNGLTETDYKFALSCLSISHTRGNSLELNKRHLASTRHAALFHYRITECTAWLHCDRKEYFLFQTSLT